MNQNSTQDGLAKTIIRLIEDRKPRDLKQLVDLAKEKTSIPEQEIIERVLQLQSQGKITLRELRIRPSRKLGTYLITKEAQWYWVIIASAAVTSALVFTIPEDAYPIVYARYMFGALFVLILPGYSLIKALFPTKEIDNIERTALSIGMSVSLVALTGLLLNYTPWGIRTTPITLSLLTLTTIMATAAIILEHKAKLKENQNTSKTNPTTNNSIGQINYKNQQMGY